MKENSHNSRNSYDIDMKPGPVTILDKRNKTPSNKFVDDVMSEIETPLSFFQFMANLEQSRSQFPDA